MTKTPCRLRLAPSILGLVLSAATVRAQGLVLTGFADDLVLGGFSRPMGIAVLPDGRFLIGEQLTALIKVVANGATAVAGTVPGVNPVGQGTERGLQHIAVDPGWPARPYLYVSYTHASPMKCWLSMFPMSGDLSNPSSTNLVLGAEYVILDGFADNSGS